MRYSTAAVWVVNLGMQATSFVVVALLFAAVRQAFIRAQALSRTDPLTGLLNRRALAEEAGPILALSRRYRHPVTLAYLDLDSFKHVNDTLGHGEGDAVLRTIGRLLRETCRTGDIPARVGGDEFVVLLAETGPDGARTLLDRLQTSLTATLGSRPVPITASVGGVTFLDAPAIDEMLRQADALMYEAKSAGRNQVHLRVVETRTAPSG
jgi:diguanylate cyclase (GGDEF)-like protein